MKKLLVSVGIVFTCFTAASAAIPAPLGTVRAIRALSDAQAVQGLPVAFTATVTYFRDYRRNLFVQDGSSGIFVKATTRAPLVPGDRVLIKGTTTLGYRPSVTSTDISILSHGPVPQSVVAAFPRLIRGQYDSTLVTVRGIVQSADMDMPSTSHATGAQLRILTPDGTVHAQVDGAAGHNMAQGLNKLLDAEVDVTGVAGGKFDGTMQVTGVVLHVSGLSDIRILKPAPLSPWSIPVTPMDQIMNTYREVNRSGRVKVSGTVTYFEPGRSLVLQNGPQSIWVQTISYAPMRIGNRAEATGFPGLSNGFLALTLGELHDTGVPAPVTPVALTWPQLASSRYLFDLVSITGTVVMEAREARQDEYVLISGGSMFSAVYGHGDIHTAPPMKQIPVGATVRVTGICVMDQSNPFGHDVPFDILLRSPDDLTVTLPAPWLTVPHLGILLGLLLLVGFVIGIRVWFIERTMRRQVAALAYVEQRRGRILEDINSAHPLAGILEHITELVSISLKGVPCWCQVADGATLGNCPPQRNNAGLRIVEHHIASRSGTAHGSLFAAFDSRTLQRPAEQKALAMAAELATLAIESSRLHSDLVHRSEFDLLTNVHNRFSLEKQLNAALLQARQTAGVFALIYIDLNAFKKVNDDYGHLAGDQYLQEVARRMKHQLRPGDMLARLGGDEFAVLVQPVQGRGAVEEIALRLSRCFDEPFVVEGTSIRGSASIGIALFPEDAITVDELLNTADTAMYSAKNSERNPANGRGRS